MKRPRKKTRSIASYRAASLKGARARKLMKDERAAWNHLKYITGGNAPLDHMLELLPQVKEHLAHMRHQRPTIDLIPKVTWP